MFNKNFAFQQTNLLNFSEQFAASSFLYKFHKTRANPNLIEKYFDKSGELKTAELHEVFQRAVFLIGKKKSILTGLKKLSQTEPDIYPSPASLINWLNKTSWGEVLDFFNYSSPEKCNRAQHKKKYSDEFLEKWMDLVAALFKAEGQSDFSILDYQQLAIEDLDIFSKEEIENYLGQDGYDKLFKMKKIPSLPTITKQLGSFNEIKRRKGLAIKRVDVRWDSSRQKLLQLLVEEVKLIKKLPSSIYIIKSERLPSNKTFLSNFDTENWNDVLNHLIEELDRQGLNEYIILDEIKNKKGLRLPENRYKQELINAV